MAEETFFDADDRKAAGRPPALSASSTRRMEWAENNYYKLPIQQADRRPRAGRPFWRDYARHDGKAPFLSRNLADASRNFTEMMFALAVLDLPFEAGKHEVQVRRRQDDARPRRAR